MSFVPRKRFPPNHPPYNDILFMVILVVAAISVIKLRIFFEFRIYKKIFPQNLPQYPVRQFTESFVVAAISVSEL